MFYMKIITRPGTIRKFKLEYYYSNTTIRKKPIVSTGCNYSNSIRIVIIPNSTRSIRLRPGRQYSGIRIFGYSNIRILVFESGHYSNIYSRIVTKKDNKESRETRKGSETRKSHETVSLKPLSPEISYCKLHMLVKAVT